MTARTTGQAEVKPFKVGEPLTGNADGNPEPSILTIVRRACVETRRRVCIKCGGEISDTKYSNAKYCSVKCAKATSAYLYRVRHGLIAEPGVGSGGNQLGMNNHMYKTGIGTYRQRAYEHYGKKCNRCESTRHLVVHHRDEDRTNNDLTNLEVLCKRCHQRHHEHRDIEGKYTKG